MLIFKDPWDLIDRKRQGKSLYFGLICAVICCAWLAIGLFNDRGFDMNKKQRRREPKYTDAFKWQLVAEGVCQHSPRVNAVALDRFD